MDAVYRKVTLRIVPLPTLGFMVAYIDRVNVGFAKLQFTKDLHFGDAVYGLGAGLFFAGYFLFEVPSNLLLERIGAWLTLARIMITWGLLSGTMALVATPWQFYGLRFALGLADAGFFPGIILYLTYWFPPERRGRITALFAMGASLAGVVGSPLSGWLLGLDGLWGWRGWQVLFIVEALPAVLLGIVYLVCVDDRPEDAAWLTEVERALVLASVGADRAESTVRHTGVVRALRDLRVVMLALADLSILAGTQAVALWTPTLLSRFGISASLVAVLSALPLVMSIAAMLLLGRSSDRSRERRWHFAGAVWVAGACLAALATGPDSLKTTILLLGGTAGGAWAALAVFWTMPPTVLSASARAGVIAFISSAGALGGFVSPVIIGLSSSWTGRLHAGFSVIATMLACSGLIALAVAPRAAGRATHSP